MPIQTKCPSCKVQYKLADTMLGKKVERTLEVAMWLMVAFVGSYLLLINLTTVSWSTWGRVATGFVSVGQIPEGVDWALIAAFAAYSGMGGIDNAFLTNWMRDKGYGMGSTVGYIPTALGDRVTLAAQGNVFEVNDDSLKSWRNWWKFLNVDQCVIFGLGSLIGMALMMAAPVTGTLAVAGFGGVHVGRVDLEVARAEGGPGPVDGRGRRLGGGHLP